MHKKPDKPETTNNPPTRKIVTKEETLNQMLELWAEKIPGDPLPLDNARRCELDVIFRVVFHSSLTRWEAFIELITLSEVLMQKARKSHAFLDWAIKPENCVTILDGDYTDEAARPSAMMLIIKLAERLAEENRIRRSKTAERPAETTNMNCNNNINQ